MIVENPSLKPALSARSERRCARCSRFNPARCSFAVDSATCPCNYGRAYPRDAPANGAPAVVPTLLSGAAIRDLGTRVIPRAAGEPDATREVRGRLHEHEKRCGRPRRRSGVIDQINTRTTTSGSSASESGHL